MSGALVTRATFGRPNGEKPRPRRHCRSCKARLYSGNPSTICASCNGGQWEEGDEAVDATAGLKAAA